MFSLSPGALAFGFEFVATARQLLNGLLGEQLFQRPFLNILRFVLFELLDECYCTGEDGTLVLFATGNDFGEFVDAFVDSFTTTAFDWGGVSLGGVSVGY